MVVKRRVMLFESWKSADTFNELFESVTGDIDGVEKEVETIIQDLKDEGKDAETDEVKAAILMQALDNDGEIEEIDIDKAKEEVKENMIARGKTLMEMQEAGMLTEGLHGIVEIIEKIGAVLGNSALMEFIAGKVEKLTGKRPNMGKVGATIQKIAAGIKKVTGFPAKAIGKFFEWIAGKFGMSDNVKKGAGLVGKLVVIILLFALGVTHFPVLGVGVLWWILSLTGLIGKSIEIVEIGKKLYKLVVGAKKNDKAKEEIGLSGDEIEELVPA